MSTELPSVEVNAKGARRLRDGHPWVYRSDMRDSGRAQPGDVVRVLTRHGSGGVNHLGTAFFNPQSLITLRLVARQDLGPDGAHWRDRIARAVELRARLAGDDTACRLFYAEADEIPGLIVDRYGDVVVLQTLCASADRLRETFVDILQQLLAPRAIVERNDAHSRKLEGLPERRGVLRGTLPDSIEIREGGLQFQVDLLGGHKTGAYLDQRENRVRAEGYGRGRCLDVFSYQGGFGLHLARGGASEVTCVDQSQDALTLCRASAARNGLSVATHEGNAFDFLKQQQVAKAQYDVITLDPPAFAKSRAAVPQAVRGYKEINLRALKLLRPGGILITSSCSYHMQPDRFEAMLLDATHDAGRVVQVLERRSQSRDHPERVAFPESHYLKCLVLRAL